MKKVTTFQKGKILFNIIESLKSIENKYFIYINEYESEMLLKIAKKFYLLERSNIREYTINLEIQNILQQLGDPRYKSWTLYLSAKQDIRRKVCRLLNRRLTNASTNYYVVNFLDNQFIINWK
jgi:hypothetical protein